MKKNIINTILISTMLLFFAESTFAQQTAPKQSMQTDYLTKSKKQKKVGRILLAGGAILMASAFIIPRGELQHSGFCVNALLCDRLHFRRQDAGGTLNAYISFEM